MNRQELYDLLVSYAKRTDLGPAFSAFLLAAESKIARDVRSIYGQKLATGTFTAGENPLPAGYLETMDIAVNGRPSYLVSWEAFVDGKRCNTYREIHVFYGQGIHIVQGGPYEWWHHARLPALTMPADTHALLEAEPLLYLNALLKEVGDWSMDLEMSQRALSEYNELVARINADANCRRTSTAEVRINGIPS
jgi:hypothetical protein